MNLLIDTTGLIAWGGLAIIIILIFAETGLLVGLAVPGGETLVFTAGLLVSTDTLHVSIILLLFLLIVAGFLGDLSGYFIGKRLGKNLYEKEDTWYFKKKYFRITEDYLQKNSKKTLIGGKFLPIIRPFVPLASGLSHIELPKFLSLSFLAAVLYMTTFSLAGYFLGNTFPVIKDYIGWILPISIIAAVIIGVVQLKKHQASKD